jgi:hypothetical protein
MLVILGIFGLDFLVKKPTFVIMIKFEYQGDIKIVVALQFCHLWQGNIQPF